MVGTGRLLGEVNLRPGDVITEVGNERVAAPDQVAAKIKEAKESGPGRRAAAGQPAGDRAVRRCFDQEGLISDGRWHAAAAPAADSAEGVLGKNLATGHSSAMMEP